MVCFLAVIVSTNKVDKSLMNDDGVARAVHDEHNSLFVHHVGLWLSTIVMTISMKYY